MASTFLHWLRSPAAREYFFSTFSIFIRTNFRFFSRVIFTGTHFWGPVRAYYPKKTEFRD